MDKSENFVSFTTWMERNQLLKVKSGEVFKLRAPSTGRGKVAILKCTQSILFFLTRTALGRNYFTRA